MDVQETSYLKNTIRIVLTKVYTRQINCWWLLLGSNLMLGKGREEKL